MRQIEDKTKNSIVQKIMKFFGIFLFWPFFLLFYLVLFLGVFSILAVIDSVKKRK